MDTSGSYRGPWASKLVAYGYKYFRVVAALPPPASYLRPSEKSGNPAPQRVLVREHGVRARKQIVYELSQFDDIVLIAQPQERNVLQWMRHGLTSLPIFNAVYIKVLQGECFQERQMSSEWDEGANGGALTTRTEH